ncbi:hypothetical protein BV25DRAFT_1829623 [Artomyces pyxidatus]|uniref:Uncharacterized protein n=1 Tax=Artomyces pyxidatus TaxID=48021 RepID=A0ACB8SQU3_9AGAM|nr:hypothetical protein BV25DRAFT_1829623 [Artomyces pyxidatus]
MIARPVTFAEGRCPPIYPHSSTAASINKLGYLSFPPEIILAIFDHVESLQDAVCLCLTNSLLWTIGQERVDLLLSQTIAPWAGDRIICIGDHSQSNDMPPTARETGEQISVLSSTYETVLGPLDRRPSDELQSRMTSAAWAKLRARMTEPPTWAADSAWVLCNLSKREFVLAEDIAKLTKRAAQGPFSPGGVSLGTALLSRICWSSHGSTAMSYEGNIHRGVWAGDRFQITTTDRLERLKEAGPWTDVGQSVVQEIKEIWKSEYEEDWEAEMNRADSSIRHECRRGYHYFR